MTEFQAGDRVRYVPEPFVRPFIGTVKRVLDAMHIDRRAIVEWDVKSLTDPDDDDEQARSSVMFFSQLESLTIIDRIAELA